ncbi:MAG: aminoglycoside phosphotransferase family protein [Bacteroidota bacterium]|nr:aminoglycoside phosphotransferase family protein [Bacteroidota bacterium]
MRRINNIFRHFNSGHTFSSAKELKAGHINNTYLLESAEGPRFILQMINNEVFKDPLKLAHNFEILNRYVKPEIQKQAQYYFPEIFSPRPFMPFIKDADGNYWRLMEYIENTSTYDIPPDPTFAFEGAKAFGNFQKTLLGLSESMFYTTITSFRNLNMRVRSLKTAIKRDLVKRKESANDEINNIIHRENINTDNHRLLKSGRLKKKITHNDTKPNNVLFDRESGKAKSVIDFDTVQPGYLIYDFGDMVRSFCNPAEEDAPDLQKVDVDREIFRAIASGYIPELAQEFKKLEAKHISLGIKTIIYMQAARFLTDYLNGDIYYKTTYPEHNLNRCRNQLKMLEQYLKKENELVRIIK